MPYILSNSTKESCNIHYEDYGSGTPLVLVGGWPFGGNMWEYQVDYFVKKGFRCISYDRRGFGKSDYPFTGYDYDSLAGDLRSITSFLQLKKFILIGFSMGGGEVARYISKYGDEDIIKVVFIGSVTPYLLKTKDNDGFPMEGMEGMMNGVLDDRPGFFEAFNQSFFGKSVSNAYLAAALQRQMNSSLHATLECIRAFVTTDFREDIKKIKIPVLMIHGTKDEQVPIEFSAEKMEDLLPGQPLIRYENQPHGIFLTNRKKLNEDIYKFISQ